MAGLKGKSEPPGNMNAFEHGLAAIQKRREEGVFTEHEEGVRQQILDGLIADKGGDESRHAGTTALCSRNVFSTGTGPNLSSLRPPEFWWWDHYSVQIDISTSL